ncbi:MAG: GPP34 family phosphoprotein [Bacteroidales bacterium]
MEFSIAQQFTILSLHPEKGTRIMDGYHFGYSLAGACLMDFYRNGEILYSDKRIHPSTPRTIDPYHDRLIQIVKEYPRPRKAGYWIRKLSWGRRKNFLEVISILESRGIVSDEKLYFLGFIPYHRYHLNDKSIRNEIVEKLRKVVIGGMIPDPEKLMLLCLLRTSGATRILANDWNERGIVRSACRQLMRRDENGSEAEKFVRAVAYAVRDEIASSEATHSA